MFGGWAFMYRGHMLAGIVVTLLRAGIGPDEYAAALRQRYVCEKDFSGMPMKGYVDVDPAGIELDADLNKWI